MKNIKIVMKTALIIPATSPKRISKALIKNTNINVTVSKKQKVTKNLKSLYFDNIKNTIKLGIVTHIAEADDSGRIFRFDHGGGDDPGADFH